MLTLEQMKKIWAMEENYGPSYCDFSNRRPHPSVNARHYRGEPAGRNNSPVYTFESRYETGEDGMMHLVMDVTMVTRYESLQPLHHDVKGNHHTI